MPTNYKYASVQGTTSTSSFATLYTVPASTQAVISTISICNTSGVTATYSIGFATTPVVGTTAPPAADMFVSGTVVAANDTTFLTLGIALEAGRVIRVSSSANTVSFQAFVSEIT